MQTSNEIMEFTNESKDRIYFSLSMTGGANPIASFDEKNTPILHFFNRELNEYQTARFGDKIEKTASGNVQLLVQNQQLV